jgi:S1-C subfamily serine protease
MRKNIIWWIVLVLILGGLSGVIFNRFVIPWLATLPGLSSLHKLESNNPVIINRKEEIQYNDGANFSDLAKQASAYTVSIYAKDSNKFLGNGIITSADGMILASKTNLGQNNLVVVTNDGNIYPGLLRALDPRSELAVITIQASNLPFAQFVNASDLVVSQRVIFLGRSNQEFNHQFEIGFVTSTTSNQASLDKIYYSESFENTVQTDARLNSDFVGGPAIDLNGKVVGITTSNLGILPGEDLQSAVTSFLRTGKIQRPTLGIKYNLISQSLAKLKNLPSGGVLVVSVDDGSPAKKAGIIVGDLITEIDGQPLPSANFEKILNQHDFTSIPLVINRGGNEINLNVILEPK